MVDSVGGRPETERTMAVAPDRETGAAGVPFAMEDSLHVPRERYFDRAFFELERERLWPHVWQMACRVEEIPRPGDFVEYEICDQSIILVRQADDSIRAFFNACRHRATELAKGNGSFPGGQIVCPFHGWRWNLDGSSSFVFGPEGFAPECLDPADLRLRECLVDTWAACVWINMDLDAPPLLETLAPVPALLDPLGVENMRVWWWKEVILEANWKMAQEAFLEGYHTMQTHPQIRRGPDDEAPPQMLAYETYPQGHSSFRSAGPRMKLTPDQYIELAQILWEGQDAMTLERDLRVMASVRDQPGAEDNFPVLAVGAIYEHAEQAGIPIAPYSAAMKLWGGEVFAFPNYFVLPQFANALCYRARPFGNDPERCRFEVWSLTTYPEGGEPGPPKLKGRFAKDDAENWGLIPLQDFSNIERQQRGLHSRSFEQLRLATDWERAISKMHEALDRYLAR